MSEPRLKIDPTPDDDRRWYESVRYLLLLGKTDIIAPDSVWENNAYIAVGGNDREVVGAFLPVVLGCKNVVEATNAIAEALRTVPRPKPRVGLFLAHKTVKPVSPSPVWVSVVYPAVFHNKNPGTILGPGSVCWHRPLVFYGPVLGARLPFNHPDLGQLDPDEAASLGAGVFELAEIAGSL